MMQIENFKNHPYTYIIGMAAVCWHLFLLAYELIQYSLGLGAGIFNPGVQFFFAASWFVEMGVIFLYFQGKKPGYLPFVIIGVVNGIHLLLNFLYFLTFNVDYFEFSMVYFWLNVLVVMGSILGLFLIPKSPELVRFRGFFIFMMMAGVLLCIYFIDYYNFYLFLIAHLFIGLAQLLLLTFYYPEWNKLR